MNYAPFPESIQLDPEAQFTGAVFATLAEWTDHVQLLIEQEGHDLRPFLSDEKKMRLFIRAPMLQYWSELTESKQQELRHSLQYLLIQDEFLPYVVANPNHPHLKEKKGSLTQKIRDGCQNTMVPYDGYALCQWMWEILFSNEDWHTDISNWIVPDRLKNKAAPAKSVSPTSSGLSERFRKLFGFK